MLGNCEEIPGLPEIWVWRVSQVANKLPNELLYNHRCDKGSEKEVWDTEES